MILNFHSILGEGALKKTLNKGQQRMNYFRSAFCIRFIVGIMSKSFYESNEENFFSLVDRMVEDLLM